MQTFIWVFTYFNDTSNLAEWDLYLCFDQLSFQLHTLPDTHYNSIVMSLYIELLVVLINWFYGASFM